MKTAEKYSEFTVNFFTNCKVCAGVYKQLSFYWTYAALWEGSIFDKREV